MFANSYKINITTVSTASTATTINIPINLEFQLVDQSELVERVFVETEVENSINPIFDYEKIRLTPILVSLSNLTGTTVVNNPFVNPPTGTITTGGGGGTSGTFIPTGTIAASPSSPASAPASTTTFPAGNFVANNPTVSPALPNINVGSTSVPAALGNVVVSSTTSTTPPQSSIVSPSNPSVANVSIPNALTSFSSSSSLVASSSSNSVATINTSTGSVVAVNNVSPSNAATLGGFNVTNAATGNAAVNSGNLGNFGNVGNLGGLFSAFISGSLPTTFDSSSCTTSLSGYNVNNIVYNISFLTGTPPVINGVSTYNDIGFSDSDIKFKTNAFKQSFLSLLFYDSDNALEQRLISYVDLFPNITGNDLNPLNATNGLPGQPKPASEIPVSFVISNPLLKCSNSSEGFYLYDYKDTIPVGGFKYLYMRASFNNAKTGKITNLMVDDSPYTIDNLVNKLYTRYILIRNNTGFYYKIDDTYNLNTSGNHTGANNVTITNNNIIVNLYQIQAL